MKLAETQKIIKKLYSCDNQENGYCIIKRTGFWGKLKDKIFGYEGHDIGCNAASIIYHCEYCRRYKQRNKLT